jgi:competence protein ComEC
MKPIKNKAAVCGFSYFAGIGIASYIGFAGAVLVIAALVLGIIRRFPIIALTLFSIGAGCLAFTITDIVQRQPVFEAAGQTIEITGTVEDKSELAFYQSVYTIKTEINGVTTRILLTAPDNHKVSRGDFIEADITLSEFRNSGIFPEKSYNHSRGILLKAGADSVEFTEHGRQTAIHHIHEYNEYIRSLVMSAFPHRDLNIGGLLCAVFLGDKSQLSPESAHDIRISGAAHFTAVSGLHMTMIAHMLMSAFGLTPWKSNRKVKFIALLIAVAILAVFFNLTVSVTRAAIMLIIFYGGELFMRKGNTLNSMGFALLLILISSPFAAFDAGLLMSFAGTFGVGAVAPVLTGRESARRGHRALQNALITSTCAAVCVLPAAALFFGGISLSAPIVSVIILPFFTLAAGAMVLFAATGGFFNIFLLIAGAMSKIMNEIITFFGQLTQAWISLDYWFVPIWIISAISAVSIIRFIYKSDTKAIKSACITIAGLALMISIYNANASVSERTYITIYSDSAAAWVTVRQGSTELIVVTADTPRAYSQIRANSSSPAFLALLDTRRSFEQAFGGVAENGIYDISGRFILEVGQTESRLTINDFSILFTRAGNDNATPADIIIASGWVRNKRDFNSEKVVYVSRSIPIENDYEINAYFDPVYLIL